MWPVLIEFLSASSQIADEKISRKNRITVKSKSANDYVRWPKSTNQSIVGKSQSAIIVMRENHPVLFCLQTTAWITSSVQKLNVFWHFYTNFGARYGVQRQGHWDGNIHNGGHGRAHQGRVPPSQVVATPHFDSIQVPVFKYPTFARMFNQCVHSLQIHELYLYFATVW